jgi:diguanylate cyclase (GGDEF)-like protein/PAS domain S-box-containing protein
MLDMAVQRRIVPDHGGSPDAEALVSQLQALQIAFDTSEVHTYQQALQESERRYHELVDNVPAGVYRAAADGTVTLANPALYRMLGRQPSESLTTQRADSTLFNTLLSADGEVRGLEGLWIRKDGGHVNVRESARAVRNSEGAVAFVEGIVEDISAEKRAQAFDAGSRSVLEMVARNEPLNDILARIASLLEADFPGCVCTVFIHRDGMLYPIPACDVGLQDSYASVAIRPGNGVSGQAAYTRGTVVVSEAAESDVFSAARDTVRELGIRAAWSTPICTDGRLQGCIAVHTKDAAEPGMHEIGLVETASRLAAVAIEHRCLHDNLRRQATRDRLTGLPNRSVFEETLADKLQKDTPVALLWIDLDRFKEINDSLGHRIGDALLLQVAGRLSESTPDAALLARIGGDEFAIILDAACRAEAEDCAREIASGLQAVFQVEDYELFVTASVGISMYPEHAGSAVELQKKADAAMYCAKGRGKNGFSFYDVRLERGARERLELETGLRRALQNGEMRLFYQPQVDLDGRPLAMEALLRWLHPKRGIVAPADFIPIAEETGLIVPLGSWVIREACRQCADWRSAGFDALRVAVNVSTLQFYFSDLVEIVRTALDTSNLPSACLELELTESLIMRNSDESTRELQRLRALGVTVAIDDFGTGYSSLSYLQNLPIDLLKIDRSFLNDVEVVSRAAVIQAITSLAHGLGLRVAAEGIETESQLDSIRRIGVDLAQGYLFGKPMSVEDASAYLKGRG